jgi:hypothetical protein
MFVIAVIASIREHLYANSKDNFMVEVMPYLATGNMERARGPRRNFSKTTCSVATVSDLCISCDSLSEF